MYRGLRSNQLKGPGTEVEYSRFSALYGDGRDSGSEGWVSPIESRAARTATRLSPDVSDIALAAADFEGLWRIDLGCCT